MSIGHLDAAQEAFDKASALAEHDPHVVVDEARIACVKADLVWLKLRLLPADDTSVVRATQQQLDERVARARQTSDEAVEVAPGDPAAARANVDALRLTGNVDAARRAVAKVVPQATQPEAAYTLAALDLAEADPAWPTVVERLRLAASGEGNAGRARAALIYALVRSGDVADATAELARLDALARPHPLAADLRAFVERAAAKPTADAGAAPRAASSAPPVTAVQALPLAPGGPSVSATGTADPRAEAGGGMAAAARAVRKGDFAGARQIYEALVTRNPSDSEALAGIGDMARAQGDTQGAIASYKRALAVNPSYLPALLGVADTAWATGDRGAAQKAYKDIVDRFPQGTYPGYVQTRADGSSVNPSSSGHDAKSAPSDDPGGL